MIKSSEAAQQNDTSRDSSIHRNREQRTSFFDADQELLNGAQNRENNFKLRSIDFANLQEYSLIRKNSKDSQHCPQTPLESPSSQNQTNTIPERKLHLFQGKTPSQFNFENFDASQNHKKNVDNSMAIPLNNTLPITKSTLTQTPFSQTSFQIKDFKQLINLQKIDNEEIKLNKQSSFQDSKKISLEDKEVPKDARFGQMSFRSGSLNKSQRLMKKQSFTHQDASHLIPQNNSQAGFIIESQNTSYMDSKFNQGNMSKSKESDLDDLSFLQKQVSIKVKGQKDSITQINQTEGPYNSKKSKFSSSNVSNLKNKQQGGGFELLKRMSAMKHVKLFLDRLSSFTVNSNFKILSEYHFKLIEDLSSFLKKSNNNYSHKDMPWKKKARIFETIQFKQYRRLIIKQIQKVPVFDPNSFALILWDIVMLIVQTIVCLIVPIMVCFQIDFKFYESSNSILSSQFLLFFIIDVFLSLNRGIYISGSAVIDRKIIMNQYFKKMLISDLITLLSFYRVSKYFSLLILIRLQYIVIIIDRLDDHFQIRMRFSNLSQLIFMISKIFLIAHFCSCGLYLISRLSVQIAEENQALIYLFPDRLTDKYINCLYFALITMSTVGYGDITPKNDYEKCYVMVMTMLSSAIFGFVVNTVGQIFQDIAQRSATFRQKKFDIITYMNIRNIQKNTQVRAIKYLEYMQLDQNQSHLKGETIIDSLPSQLSSEIKIEFYGKILQQSNLFSPQFSNSVINSIALQMKELSLAPGQFLLQPGQKEFKLYFLLQGSLSEVIKGRFGDMKTVQQMHHKYTMIGQRFFFSEQADQNWVKCEETCNLAYINLSDLKDSLAHFPLEYERFCQLRDMILYEGKNIDSPCSSCKKYYHSVQDCPLIHLKLNKMKIIHSKLFTTQQERQNSKECFRKTKKIFNTLLESKMVAQKLRKIRVDKIKEQLQLQKQNFNSDDKLNVVFQNGYFDEQIDLIEEIQKTSTDKKFYYQIPVIIYETDEDEYQQQQDNFNSQRQDEDDNDFIQEDYDEDLSEEEAQDDDEYEDDIPRQPLTVTLNTEKTANEESTVELNDRISAQLHPIELNDNQIYNLGNPPSNIFDRNSISSSNHQSISSKNDHINNFQSLQIKSSHLTRNGLHDDTNFTELKKTFFPANQSLSKYLQDESNPSSYFQLPKINSSSSIQSIKQDKQVSFNQFPSVQSIKPFPSAINSHQPQQTNQSNLKDQVLTGNNNNHDNNLYPYPQYQNDQILKIINQALQFTNLQPLQINNQMLGIPQPNSPNSNFKKSLYKFTSKTNSGKTDLIRKSIKCFEKQKSDKIPKQLSGQFENFQNSLHKNMEVNQKHQQLFFYDFDVQKKMVNYFPKFNMTSVVSLLNKKIKQKYTIIKKNQKTENHIVTSVSNIVPERTNRRNGSPFKKKRMIKQSSFQLQGKQIRKKQ